jgi:hypothetical protein
VKERPILFSGPMVKAILEGKKTQTRRVVNPQPDGFWDDPNSHPATGLNAIVREEGGKARDRWIHCPYGAPGERLWVREAFCSANDRLFYRADDWLIVDKTLKWTPSIHMPRVASRITLEIIGIRVQRIQDTSEADAKAEGRSLRQDDPAGYFPDTWDALNALRGYSWMKNPWVWVVEFKRVS